jgi:glycosyltransferase involved in cell wall biosynthesis/GR25 family glycosyltransferase involved in LPS biosynthesis
MDLEPLSISLTSIRSRSDLLRQTLASLINQDFQQPYQIHVYLSHEPYLLDEGFKKHPTWPELETAAFRDKLQFHFVRNTGPYRKLIPLLSQLVTSGSDAPIVTCDDDTIYPPHWLRTLVEEHKHSRGIVAFRGHTMTLHNGVLTNYDVWLKQPKANFSMLNLPTGKDGVFYRPSLLDRGVLDLETALRLAPTADDLWFKIHSLLAFTPVRIVSDRNSVFWSPSSKAAEATSLWSRYNETGGNDKTLRLLVQHIRETRGICLARLLADAATANGLHNGHRPTGEPLALRNYRRQIHLFEMHRDQNSAFLKTSLQRRDAIRRSAARLFRCGSAPSPQHLVLAVKTWNRQDYLKRCLDSFLATCCTQYQWTLLVADDGSTDGTLEYLDGLSLPIPFHVIRNRGAYACGQFNSLNDLALAIGYDVCFHADDDVIFAKPGWDTLYLDAIRESGLQHLCYRNLQHYESLARKQKTSTFTIPPATTDESGRCAAYVDVLNCDGSFFTVTPQVFRRVGYADETNFPIRGQWHIDYSARCARAGFNQRKSFFDAKNSNDYITLQALSEDYRCSLPWGDEYKKTKDPAELARRYALVGDESRLFVGPHSRRASDRTFETHLDATTAHPARFTGLNDFADCVYLLNLDSRPDRLQTFDLQAKRLGFKYTRVPAVDGRTREVGEEYEAYARQRRRQPHFGKAGAIKYCTEFYLHPQFSIADREIFLERNGIPAIASVGAWAYRATYIRILREAIERGCERIVIFDDDVLFHDDFHAMFTEATAQLPEDWMVWLLGAMQFGWKPEEAIFRTPNLYCCNGSSVASHATLLKGDAIKLLLDQILQFQAPMDIGPLAALQRDHKDKCFISFPNLVIQSGLDSDINTSSAHGEGRNPGNRFRWEIEKYSNLSNLAC